MHQKKSEIQIGKESSGISSDFNPTPPLSLLSIHHKHPQIKSHPTTNNTHFTQTQTQPHTFFTIQISPSSLQKHPPPPPTHQTHFRNEPFKTLLPAPHKRPIMTQSPSSLSSSLHHYHHHQPTKLPFTNTVAFKLLRHLGHARSLRVRFRFFLLLSLPSLYFLILNHRRSFVLDLLSALAFSACLVISINLTLPRLPSIRLFLARSLPIKLSPSSPTSRPPQPVYWSIGSKPKSEKRPNSGSCVQVYSNGDVYEGEFHKGKCTGSGVYYYYMSGRYEGDWVDEKYDGYGVETWARGSRYRGQYRQGLRHGIGVYRFYTGDVYAGEWSSGQSHGCGVHTCEDGSRYVGEFKWGVKHGLGHYHFRNGDTYAGEYFADKMHGFGAYRFGNGHRYEGAWHEGRRQGLGMYTFRNGETQSGHWQNGVLDVPSTQNTHSGSPFAVNHSKVLNAVQEARRAAEKAYDVAKVDERVNKAIAAANKAANAARVAAVKAVQEQVHPNGNNNDVPIPIV
ncbi:hypothetical protein L1049_027196 [Liquidambar formosana]|uniref:Uncharacterized protein n=1 Tax=Liquidambar formosana TaxID=63359 RepID=A0AAP0QZT6_LIQFO